MAKKQKTYVVWQGHKPGIYSSWDLCKKQVDGFSKPIFKAFDSFEIAQKAFQDRPDKYLSENYIEPTMLLKNLSDNQRKPILKSLSVDAACSGNPGVLEYQGVDTETGKLIFHQGPFPLGTVNLGEFLALVHGLAYLKQIKSTVPVYSDSVTAIAWLRRKAINTNLPRTEKTEALFQLIDRALVWIKSNEWTNPVLKWETEIWGEIPADFGRK